MEKRKTLWDRPTAIIALTGGIVFGVAAVIYAMFPAISNYLWCFYVGYFMTVITGQNPKNLKSILFASSAGISGSSASGTDRIFL